ncbi:MAG: hypothetical protein HYV09_21880 [Deltaproteobacteria bacterium]|nr:hypothetical protein [Deltaproteobacteria bacterium]
MLIVHGARDPKTKKVEQQILFTLYSKAEAKALLDGTTDVSLESLLQHEHPERSFDWRSLKAGIRKNLSVLPDTYESYESRALSGFRRDLVAFVRQLLLADAQSLLPAAKVLQENRHALEVLRDLAEWRIDTADQKPDEWNQDNAFYWRSAAQGKHVPPEAEEIAAGYLDEGKLDQAEAAFRLLIEAFPNYAEGWNYLGIVELRRDRPDRGLPHFERTIELGRTLFPTNIAKRNYWTDHRTRPYMRGLQNAAHSLIRLRRFAEARVLADRLENECGDDIAATSYRAAIFLNCEQWAPASEKALRLRELHPSEDFVAAFALFEVGAEHDARASFLHAALNHPQGARLVVGGRDKSGGRVEPDDHNAGVEILHMLPAYLEKPSRSSVKFFRELLEEPKIAHLIDEVEALRERWREPGADRGTFERLSELRTSRFARSVVDESFAAAPNGRTRTAPLSTIRLYRGLKEAHDPTRTSRPPGDGNNFTDCPFTALQYATGTKGCVLVVDVPDDHPRLREELWLNGSAKRFMITGPFDAFLVHTLRAQDLRAQIRRKGVVTLPTADKSNILRRYIAHLDRMVGRS